MFKNGNIEITEDLKLHFHPTQKRTRQKRDTLNLKIKAFNINKKTVPTQQRDIHLRNAKLKQISYKKVQKAHLEIIIAY